MSIEIFERTFQKFIPIKSEPIVPNMYITVRYRMEQFVFKIEQSFWREIAFELVRK